MNIPGLHETITRLNALRRGSPKSFNDNIDERLKEFAGFGSNPGQLHALSYVPQGVGAGMPLVVVLHGCTQTAGSYNRGAGWTSAADEHGFALLFPEQQRSNNPNLCFNWFSSADASRGRGEALSIVQMVQQMCTRYALDDRRVYITGLSAGGAMTAAMLATYPDVFAGGGVIAGLPFGTATSVPEALEKMRGQGRFEADELTRLVRSASKHSGPWPVLSVWHGSSDRTVDASNAAALVDQWRGLHGVDPTSSSTEAGADFRRRIWSDQEGSPVIEEFIIGNMGHGTPIDPVASGESSGPYMLDVGISSTRHLVRFWGLDQEGRSAAASTHIVDAGPPDVAAPVTSQRGPSSRTAPSRTNAVQEVIERALKSAGLMS